MNEDLFSIIYNYSINNKKADDTFIEYVIRYLITYYETYDYITNYEIIPKELIYKSALHGTYSNEDKKIKIFLGNIEYHTKKINEVCTLNNINECFFFNSQVMVTILHEFEHVLQNKKITESEYKDILSRKDNELFLLFVSQIFSNEKIYNFIYNDKEKFKKKMQKMYNKTYIFNPEERLAHINSLSNIKDILNNNIIDLDLIINIFNNKLYAKTLKGYTLKKSNKIICPSEQFLKTIGKNSIWKSYNFYDRDTNKLLSNCIKNYDLESRLRYGFPIDNEEYFNLEDELENTYQRVLKAK